MKKYLVLVFIIFHGRGNAVYSQQLLPSVYAAGLKVNFVRTWHATAPENNATALITRPLRDVKQTTEYFDGLGRPLQTVVKKGSLITTTGVSADMVSPIVYDEFGRERLTYLPFASTATDASKTNGLFKLNPFQQQVAFYNAQLSGQAGETNVGSNALNWAYSQDSFEPSPLNRITETFAPGSSWVGSAGQTQENNRRSIKIKYYTNTAIDGVRMWKVTTGASFGVYTPTGTYQPGQLYKTITIDDKNNQVIEFKDKVGKVILKKVQLDPTVADDWSGKSHSGWLCTYYLYDDLENLQCVIQPRGVELISGSTTNWALNNGVILAEQCFRYAYDHRNRMIIKQVPGADYVYMVYDARDRLVMMQDGNLRDNGKWLVTLYHNLNRPVQTGILSNEWNNWNNKTILQHRTDASASTDYPFTAANIPASYWQALTITGYDGYAGLPAASGLNNSVDNSYLSYVHTSYNTSPTYAQPVPSTASVQTKGLVTWTQTRILGTETFVYRVNIYDDKDRLVQIKSRNPADGTMITTTQYNWASQALVIVEKQDKISSINPQSHTVITKMDYDELGRVLNVKKTVASTINNVSISKPEQLIVQNEYDALGQVKKKKLGNKPGASVGTPLANLDYDYNVRGWLLSINKNYITSSSNSDQYFGMELGYDKNASLSTFTPQYNGNISGAIWKSEGDQQKRKYDFSYDAINRLTGADFNQYVSGAGVIALFDKSAGVNFTVNNFLYDPNGNLVSMDHWGLKLNSSVPVDRLRYYYETYSNKLTRVTDLVTAPDNGKLGDFKDGTNISGTADYNYDSNGNLTLDNNKGINSIVYNHLNLPSVITVTGKGTIAYTHDAEGNKLKKVTTETNAIVPYNGANYTGNIITTTTYFGGAVYESKDYQNASLNALDYTDQLQFLQHEEGRVRFVKATPSTCISSTDRFVFDYFLKDHLGNVRTLLTEQKEDICYLPATVEDANYATEQKLYDIVDARRIARTTVGAPQTSFQSKLYQTHGGIAGQKTGLGVTLKVMAGDKVKIFTESFYTLPSGGNTGGTFNMVLSDLLTAFAGSGVVGANKGTVTPADVQNLGTNSSQISSFITRTPAAYSAKAYLNWILFDEQLRYVNAGAEPVGSSTSAGGSVYKQHISFTNAPVNITKSGYFYVFVSNESNLAVFFDNMVLTHTPGPILEETQYYPFGLAMAGISSKALSFGQPENKIKYNGYEYNATFDINLYESFYRSHDPQIGRFWQVDPKPNVSFSPYAAMANNPILFSDKLGDTAIVTLSNVTVTNSKKVNANFGVALANLIANKSGINSIEKLLQGTGVRLAEGQIMRSFLGPAAGIASLPFTLSSDNMSAANRRRMADAILNEMLMKGDLRGVIAYVENWNGQRRNQHDRIVFRYMSIGEFDNRLQPDDDLAQALPFDGKGNYGVKYITPDIYVTSSSAKASLALPSSPDIVIWTYESQILQTKMPAGAGQYQTVKGTVNGPGGGREATILQPFPIHGFFPLINK